MDKTSFWSEEGLCKKEVAYSWIKKILYQTERTSFRIKKDLCKNEAPYFWIKKSLRQTEKTSFWYEEGPCKTEVPYFWIRKDLRQTEASSFWIKKGSCKMKETSMGWKSGGFIYTGTRFGAPLPPRRIDRLSDGRKKRTRQLAYQ